MHRRWIFWVPVIALVWVGVSRFAEMERVTDTLLSGQWQWVLIAGLLQCAFFTLYATLYHAAFQAVGVRSRVRDLLPVWFASICINVIAPAAGAAAFIDDAARRGESSARAAAGIVLVRVTDFGTFALILLVALVDLLARHDLQPLEIIGALALLGIIGGWTGVLWMGLRHEARLLRLLAGLQRGINRVSARLRRPAFLTEDWAERNTAEFAGAAAAITARPRRLAAVFAVALGAHLVDLASLYALFHAFHQPVGAATLVTGFAIAVLFWIVAITPEGIGVVEGMMALTYTTLGIPAIRATAIALAFRGLSFWLPLLLGVFLLRRGRPSPEGEAEGYGETA